MSIITKLIQRREFVQGAIADADDRGDDETTAHGRAELQEIEENLEKALAALELEDSETRE